MLEINSKKSKLVCMSKSNKRNEDIFHMGDTELDQVHQYCYLGIEITSSGTFSAAGKAMSSKAAKE